MGAPSADALAGCPRADAAGEHGAGASPLPSRAVPDPGQPGFRHEALLYGGGAEGFAQATLPLVGAALSQGAPVMVAARGECVLALSRELGAAAQEVRFEDMRALGTNPARIIPEWSAFIEQAAGVPGLGIGEPAWPGRSEAEFDECHIHEQLLNRAFDGGAQWRLVCPYDADRLGDHVLERAFASHPVLLGPHGAEQIGGFPRGAAEGLLGGVLPRPRGEIWEIPFAAEDLGELRVLVCGWAQREGLEAERAQELTLAAHEIASNSIRHGGGAGMLRLWCAERSLLCEVQDAGHIRDPLIGRVSPDGEASTSRGIWIANQLCDLVQIRSSEHGTRIRLHKRTA